MVDVDVVFFQFFIVITPFSSLLTAPSQCCLSILYCYYGCRKTCYSMTKITFNSLLLLLAHSPKLFLILAILSILYCYYNISSVISISQLKALFQFFIVITLPFCLLHPFGVFLFQFFIVITVFCHCWCLIICF